MYKLVMQLPFCRNIKSQVASPLMPLGISVQCPHLSKVTQTNDDGATTFWSFSSSLISGASFLICQLFAYYYNKKGVYVVVVGDYVSLC